MDSNRSLRAVFVTNKLLPFRNGLPEASSKLERVASAVDYLLENNLSDGRSLFPLFLSELASRYQPGDVLRDELTLLAKDVEAALYPGTDRGLFSEQPKTFSHVERTVAASAKGSAADPLADLRRDLSGGEVCSFIGAGMSECAGLPGWYTLLSELAQRIDYGIPPTQWATSETLVDAAQAYINKRGLYDLIRFLKDRLDTTDIQPTTAHQALARLSISVVFTANYDDLLERSFRDAGKHVHTVVRDVDIPFMRRDLEWVNIVKLYGELDQPETIALGRQQYESFFLQRPQMVKLFENELGRAQMLYLGWSHSDPHFNLVFGEILNRFGTMMRPGYAVMFDVSEAKKQELQRKHIRMVEFPADSDRTMQLAGWLNSLYSNA